MKKFLSIILLTGMLLGIGTNVTATENGKVTVMLDGTEVQFPDAQPFIDTRDRTLVPIRFVSEAMGAEVSWEQDTDTAVIKKDGDTVRYTIGSMKAYLNNEVIVFDTYGILKEDRTFVPLRFISEMLGCDVDWNGESYVVTITSPGDAVKFPTPQVTVHYPQSESDTRLFWITVDNYRAYQRDCPNYEFKIEFLEPTEFNSFEQDEGAINGWQQYMRNQFVSLTNTGNTVTTVSRAYYTTRENSRSFTPQAGSDLKFKLIVHRKCSNETREYTYAEKLQMPYSLIATEE